MTLRQLNRRCGSLSNSTTARIQALPLEQLEALAVDAVFSGGVALLDFSGPADLRRPLAQQDRGFCGPNPLGRHQHLPAPSGVPPNASLFPPIQVTLMDCNARRITA